MCALLKKKYCALVVLPLQFGYAVIFTRKHDNLALLYYLAVRYQHCLQRNSNMNEIGMVVFPSQLVKLRDFTNKLGPLSSTFKGFAIKEGHEGSRWQSKF